MKTKTNLKTGCRLPSFGDLPHGGGDARESVEGSHPPVDSLGCHRPCEPQPECDRTHENRCPG